MSSSFNVTDFDLSFISQPSFDTGVHTYTEKHVNIQRLKRKIISINILVTQNKEKQILIEQMQKTLLASKEECKQICLEYSLAAEKCSDLENSLQLLQSTNEDLNNKFVESENYHGALQSHTNQLQLHVQEMETQVEALQIENQLEKSNAKDVKKKLTTLQSKNELLIKHLSIAREVIFGKKKLSKKFKALMKTYNKPSDDTWQEYLTEDENIAYESEAYHSRVSSPATEDFLGDDDEKEIHITIPTSTDNALSDVARKLSEVKMGSNRDDMDHDSILSNGLISEDTGRGSSLAFSDSEKCFQSPDYYLNDSPLNGLVSLNSLKSKLVERGTSPIVIQDTDASKDRQLLTVVNHKKTKDATTSPLLDVSHNIPKIVIERGTSPMNVHNSYGRTVTEHNNERKRNSYKECLELNSSDSLSHGNVDDTEVLMILDEMRMKSNLITPMPTTPSKTRDRNNSSCHEIKANKNNSLEVGLIENASIHSDNISDDLERQFGNRTPLSISIESVQNILNQSECDLSTITPSKRSQFKHPLQLLTEDKDCSSENGEQLTILDKTRMKSNLITPMPPTPSKPRDRNNSSCQDIKDNKNNLVEVNRIENAFIHSENISDDLERQFGNRIPLSISIESVQNVLTPSECDLSTIKPSKRLLFEHPLPLLTVEKECSSENGKQTAVSLNKNYTENINESLSVSNDYSAEKLCQMRMLKSRKLAKLEMLRQKIIEKKKIKRKIFLNQKLRLTPKKLVLVKKKKFNRIISSESINDKGISEISPKNIPESLPQVGNTDDTNIKERSKRLTRSNSLRSNEKVKEDEDLSHFKTTNKVRHAKVLKKKVTRLDRLRKQALPKGKIRTPATPIKSISRIKPKQLKLHKKKVQESDSSVTLNDKDVYEKALKVMAELKSKQKCVNSEKRTFKKPSAIINKKNKILNRKKRSGNDKSINNVTSPMANLSDERPVSPTQPLPHSPSNAKVINHLLPKFDCHVKDTRVSPKTNRNTKISHLSPKQIQYTPCINQSPVIMSVSSENKRYPERKCRRYSKENDTPKSPVDMIHDNPMIVVTDIIKDKHDINDGITEKNVSNTRDNNVEPVVVSGIAISSRKSNNKRRESDSVVNSEIPSKRVLRSSTIQQSRFDVKQDDKYCKRKINRINCSGYENSEAAKGLSHRVIQYDDLDLFTNDQEDVTLKVTKTSVQQTDDNFSPPKDNILFSMLDKYGKHIIKPKAKINESAGKSVCETLEKAIPEIIEISPKDSRDAMNKLVESLENLDKKHFLLGLIKYLENPERKTELFSKVYAPPAPPLTKSEQILLYVIAKLKACWADIDIVNLILNSIEYTLFRLNHTPVFETIESMSHFYAVLCRYFRMKSRLRLFLLDAMYCLQFKAVPLIRQCLDVWMHILPLSHMGIAKSPIVTCLVYLLHFYKCDDKMNRVQDIRNILNTKYSYRMSEWNETKILETLKYAIQDLRAIPVEVKMLRLSIIILAKRQGPRWCQTNIISKILQPIIDNQKTSVRVRLFCISLLGSLLKPFPADMKVNCEATMNRLLDMLKDNDASDQTKEAIFTSLIYMSRHNQYKVYKALLSYNLRQMSPDLEKLLQDYVREKPTKGWKAILSRLRFDDDDNY